MDLPGTQPRWDPRDVDDLPSAPPSTVPALPADVEPPRTSTPLSSAPLDAAVLAVEQGSTAQLLSVSGEWRSVPLPGRHPHVALSPLGSRLVVWEYAEAEPVRVYDLTTGEGHNVEYPDGYRGWDFTTWTWVDEETVLLDDSGGGWLIDAASGETTPVPYPSPMSAWWSIDPAGAVVESADWGTPRVLTNWEGGQAREVSMDAIGRLSLPQADADTVVGTSYDGHQFAAIVADRETLAPLAVLPLWDHDANYSNWGLRVLALQDDHVLLQIAAIGRRVDGFRVVTWEPESGDLSVVSSISIPVEHSVTFAPGLLRRTGP